MTNSWELRKIRQFTDMCNVLELNGDNMDYAVKEIGYGVMPNPMHKWDGCLDIGPCMGQVKNYPRHEMKWPPFWNIGFVEGWACAPPD